MLVDGHVPTWDTATRWMRQFASSLGEELFAHRAVPFDTYTASWAGAQWNELYHIDQLACEWAEQTVLLSFSGSPWLDEAADLYLPPLRHYQLTQQAADARQQALSRALDAVDRWQSVRVIGPTDGGYPRLYLGLYLSESIETDVLAPVVDAHIHNCPIASELAHQLSQTVSNRPAPEHPSKLIHALGRRVPGLESNAGIGAEPWARTAVATVLHAGNARAVRFGQSI
jgi:hypothetical protein